MNVLRLNPTRPETARARGTIAMCTRDDVKAVTAMSWLLTDDSFLRPNEYLGKFIITGNLLVEQRNQCVQRMDGDWILFIDDDMTWQPDAVRRIVETQESTGADIVGGLCFQRSSPHQPTMYITNPEGTGYTYHEVWEPGEIVDVDATGMAFCLITVKAFNKIIRAQTGDDTAFLPSHEDRKRINMAPQFFRWDGRYGEDLGFCKIAKAAGCRIVVDTGIEIGHVSERVVGKKEFWTEMFLRPDAAEEAKRSTTGHMGIRVISRAQALERVEALLADEVTK
jgi:hypothetical protein